MEPSASTERPAVVSWIKVYSGVLAVLYLLATPLLLVLMSSEKVPAEDIPVLAAMKVLVAVIMVGCGLLFGAMLFLPRSKFTWIYGIVVIALGFGSLCILPFSIALLIFWIKQETKDYYYPRPSDPMH